MDSSVKKGQSDITMSILQGGSSKVFGHDGNAAGGVTRDKAHHEMKSYKLWFSWFPKLQMCNWQKSNIIVLWWRFVMKSRDNPFNPYSYFCSSFALLYLMSQVVAQMCSAVSHAYDFMYQFILYMTFSLSLFFFFFLEFSFQRRSFTLPCHLHYQKDSVKIQRGFKGLSWLNLGGGVACIQNNTIKGSLSFFQLFLKLLSLVK